MRLGNPASPMKDPSHTHVFAAVIATAACLLACPLSGLTQPNFELVRGEIQVLSESDFAVVVRFELSGPVLSEVPLSHVSLLPAGVEVHQATASSDDVPIPVDLVRMPNAVRWVLSPHELPSGWYQISYRVTGTNGRIPIPSPEFSRTKPKTVEFSLVLPEELHPKELFPRFMRSDQGWLAILSNVPSFVIVRVWKAGQESWTDRLAAAESFTNLLIISLLVLFTLYWVRSRRRTHP